FTRKFSITQSYLINYFDDNRNDGRAFKFIDANFPCSYEIDPAAAIIAALSVHKCKGGMCSFCSLFLKRSSRLERRPLFAATPPATITSFTLYSCAAL